MSRSIPLSSASKSPEPLNERASDVVSVRPSKYLCSMVSFVRCVFCVSRLHERYQTSQRVCPVASDIVGTGESLRFRF